MTTPVYIECNARTDVLQLYQSHGSASPVLALPVMELARLLIWYTGPASLRFAYLTLKVTFIPLGGN